MVSNGRYGILPYFLSSASAHSLVLVITFQALRQRLPCCLRIFFHYIYLFFTRKHPRHQLTETISPCLESLKKAVLQQLSNDELSNSMRIRDEIQGHFNVIFENSTSHHSTTTLKTEILSFIPFAIISNTLQHATLMLSECLKMKYRHRLRTEYSALNDAYGIAGTILNEFFEQLSLAGYKNIKAFIKQRLPEQLTDSLLDREELLSKLDSYFLGQLLQCSSSLRKPNDHRKLSSLSLFRLKQTLSGSNIASSSMTSRAAKKLEIMMALRRKQLLKQRENNAVYAHLQPVQPPKKKLDILYLFIGDIEANKILSDIEFIENHIEITDSKCREQRYKPSLQRIPEAVDDDRAGGYESDESEEDLEADDDDDVTFPNSNNQSTVYSAQNKSSIQNKKYLQSSETSWNHKKLSAKRPLQTSPSNQSATQTKRNKQFSKNLVKKANEYDDDPVTSMLKRINSDDDDHDNDDDDDQSDEYGQDYKKKSNNHSKSNKRKVSPSFKVKQTTFGDTSGFGFSMFQPKQDQIKTNDDNDNDDSDQDERSPPKKKFNKKQWQSLSQIHIPSASHNRRRNEEEKDDGVFDDGDDDGEEENEETILTKHRTQLLKEQFPGESSPDKKLTLKREKMYLSQQEIGTDQRSPKQISDSVLIAETRQKLSIFLRQICLEALEFLETANFQTYIYFASVHTYKMMKNRTRSTALFSEETSSSSSTDPVRDILVEIQKSIEEYILADDANAKNQDIYAKILENATAASSSKMGLLNTCNVLEEIQENSIMDKSKDELLTFFLQL